MSLGWSIGYYSRSDRIDTLEKQLSSYTQADKLDLRETVRDIASANNVVQDNLSELRAHFQWRDEKKKLEEHISTLNGQIANLTAQVEHIHKELGKANDIIGQLENTIHKKQQEIDSFYPVNEEFWLDEHTTRGIAGFEGILGLKEVSSNRVEVTYGNEDHVLYAGNYLESKVMGAECRIILSGIDYGSPERAQFRTVCKTSHNQLNKDESR